jgi:hypothetical protein
LAIFSLKELPNGSLPLVNTLFKNQGRPRFSSIPSSGYNLPVKQRATVNRSIDLPVLVFVLLFALLLLLNGSSILSWAPESTSGDAIDRTPVEKATLALPPALGPLADAGISVSANYQRADSSIEATFNKITRKMRGVQTRLKRRVHQAFNAKVISRRRPTANLVTRFQSWLLGEVGVAHTTNRRPWKEVRISGRSMKKQPKTSRLTATGFKSHGQNWN